MNRLGFASLGELRAAMGRWGAVGADLLMSHFVSSEEPGKPLNAAQIARSRPRGRPSRLAGLARQFVRYVPRAPPLYDLARPGYALYGGNPTPGSPNPMRPVVNWRSRSSRRAGSRRARPAATTPMDRAAAHAARHPARGLRRRLAARRRRDRRPRRGGGRHRRPPLHARRAHVDGPVHRRRHRSAGGAGATRDPREFFGAKSRSTNSHAHRHDRLSRADKPRAPLSAKIHRLGGTPKAGRAFSLRAGALQ